MILVTMMACMTVFYTVIIIGQRGRRAMVTCIVPDIITCPDGTAIASGSVTGSGASMIPTMLIMILSITRIIIMPTRGLMAGITRIMGFMEEISLRITTSNTTTQRVLQDQHVQVEFSVRTGPVSLQEVRLQPDQHNQLRDLG